jgi:putative ATPase
LPKVSIVKLVESLAKLGATTKQLSTDPSPIEPLAARQRPTSLNDYVGQSHLVGPAKPLRIAVEQKHLFSFLLWGPPGVGKTTLARIYARNFELPYSELSAVSAGKEDIRKLINTYNGQQIIFLDEIHRFNKAQQDYLLPYVESGRIILIGATTENPSFEVIAALLSRTRVFTLHELTVDEIKTIITRTGLPLEDDATDWLAEQANGDARLALTLLENAKLLYGTVTLQTLKDTLQNKFLRFDKKGEEHYNTISAYIKSMRASQPDAALYYLARMIDSGEDPKFIARRMVIFASEDIGMAQPTALVVANEVFRAVETIGLPEAQINLAHGTVYMSTAAKNRSAYDGYFAALEDVSLHGNLPIPMQLRNAPTKLMKDVGYGKGYEQYTDETLLPNKLKNKTYYKKHNER